MYLVPMEIPKHCTECPFGNCHYNFPFGQGSIDNIDGKENPTGTYGYVCNIDFKNNERYTKVLRANIGEKIKKPKWCELKQIDNEFLYDFLQKRRSLYQKQIIVAERQEQQAREFLKDEPDRKDVKEDLHKVIKLQDRYSAIIDFIEELQENINI